MTRYVHIVQVHPVENGEPNLHKVKHEKEFDTQRVAELYVESYNEGGNNMFKAIYHGRVNDATGELE